MVKDPVCGMTIDEKTAAGTSDLPGADVLLLRGDLQDEVRSGSGAIRGQIRLPASSSSSVCQLPESAGDWRLVTEQRSIGRHRSKITPGASFQLRIERAFDGAHLLDAGLPVQLAQQRLLDGIAPHSVLRERTSAEPGDLSSEFQDRLLPAHHVVVRSRNHVRVHVAVGDVAPDGVVQLRASRSRAGRSPSSPRSARPGPPCRPRSSRCADRCRAWPSRRADSRRPARLPESRRAARSGGDRPAARARSRRAAPSRSAAGRTV